ncbi:hypothetical protein D3C86_1863420 [compost metagenome]
MERTGFDGGSQIFQQFHAGPHTRCGHQQNKFFTAEARNEICPAKALAQHARDDFQHFVARQMAIVVVDAFEMVEV